MNRLREISERLAAIAGELEAESAGDARAAELADEAAELSSEAVEEANRRIREGEAGVQPVSYPEDLRSLVDAELEQLRFPAPALAGGLEEAMRYSLLAGGKRVRPVLALATARALGAEPERFLPGRLRDRADPHLLADPRRPAGDGRRRAAARFTDVPSQVRRGRGDPRRRRSLRRGDAALLRAAGRAGAGARRAAGAERGDRGRRHGRRPVRRRRGRGARRGGPADAARAEDRAADRRQRRRRARARGSRRT